MLFVGLIVLPLLCYILLFVMYNMDIHMHTHTCRSGRYCSQDCRNWLYAKKTCKSILHVSNTSAACMTTFFCIIVHVCVPRCPTLSHPVPWYRNMGWDSGISCVCVCLVHCEMSRTVPWKKLVALSSSP